MPATPAAPSPSARVLLWVVAIAFFMQALDMTILNTALPAMAQSLGESPLRMHSVLIAYMLTVAILIPASGWIADRWGTRRVFAWAIALFTLGSLACAQAQSLPVLVAARVLQGLGGALMMPVGRLAVLRTYPRAQLVQAMSFVTMPGLVGPLIGPALGGWLVEVATWHWIFLINLPIGVIGIVVAHRLMPDLRGPAERFDWVGFILFANAMVLVSLALEGLGELHFNRLLCGLLFGCGVTSLIAYALHARRSEAPLFSPRLFRSRWFTIGVTGGLLARFGGGAMPFLTPLLLQVGLGYPASQAGLTMVPLAAAALTVKPLVHPLVERFGFRRLLAGNTVLVGALIASFGFIDAATPLPALLVLLTVFGAANSLQFTLMNTITLQELPDEHASAGNSALSVVMQLSRSLGVAVAGLLLGAFIGSQGGLLPAFHATYFVLGAATAGCAAIFSLLTPYRAPPQAALLPQGMQP